MTDSKLLRRAASRVRDFRHCRLLVLGDVMLDRYVWGQASRVSPEAPVLVVEAERETDRLGGAANVAWNVRAMGAECHLVGAVGQDARAAELGAALARVGVDPSGLLGRPGVPTTLKTRIVAHQQQVLRLDQEKRLDLEPAEAAQLIETARALLDRVQGVVVSDYGKGVVTAQVLEALLPEMRSRGLPVCVDPKERHVSLYRGVSTLTPNTSEAGEVVGTRVRDEDSLLRVGWAIQRLTEARSVLITRGKDGMALFEPPATVTHLPAVAREVYDVTGAGDTVVAMFGLTLCAGGSFLEAAVVANHAAAQVIREVGTAVPTPDELVASLEEHSRGQG
ncbi:MAG TPA: D-glycero-beta-D-manno-heptose-7-phosphate kinase [Candidatus Saccharimonadales bacterium]|nr:D-glycero-beta-D-manno-heptose-7-phosphate kinase [Candidatus Saccharimonadales bacterium]